MDRIARTLLASGLVLIAWGVAPGDARGGVPRSCRQPAYDPLECPRELREQYRKVLPAARLRELQRQRGPLEKAGARPVLDLQRNELLEQLRDALAEGAPPG